MKHSCIIVEDEPLAVEILETYVKQVPFLNLVQVFNNAIDAMSFLKSNKVEVVFLDLHLPKLKGLDFLRTLKESPKVIITTAYHQYALQGYEFNVIDYLLKPIEFSRFMTAVNKLDFNTSSNQNEQGDDTSYLFFNVNKKKVKVYIKDIIYIESQKEYIKIFFQEKSILTKMALTEIEELLPTEEFLRVHRSFIISKKKIEAFTANDVELCGKQIPIGRSYKELVQTTLDKMF